MNKVIKLLYAGLFLLIFSNYSPAFAYKNTHLTNYTSVLIDVPDVRNAVDDNSRNINKEKLTKKRSVTKADKKLARKKRRLKKFLKSRLGKWLIKRAIKKQERRQKRWQRKYERKKKRWLAKGKDITKLKKKQRSGNIRTGLLLVIIGALFFFVLGTLSPFDIIGIVVAALGLLLILLYLLT